jgi:hypothetical protein
MQLLQPTMGKDLPVEVRDTLLGLGTSCNDATVLVSLADGVDGFVQRRLECVHVLAPAAQSADDMTAATEGWRNRAIAAFARAAVKYAVYASRVAESVAAGETPHRLKLEHVVPSMLASDFNQLLPVIQFPTGSIAAMTAADSVALLLEKREALVKMVRRRLHGDALDFYDDLHVDGSAELTDGFPRLLHEYATEMVHVIGLFSGTADPDFN